MAASVTPHARVRTHKRRRLTPHQICEVAVKAFCNTRTVERYLDGDTQRSTTTARIAAALVTLGLEGKT